MEYIDVELRSVSPLLMHRYCGEEPSQEKHPRGKKTLSHIEAAHKRDWFKAAYWSDGTFHIPAEIVEAALAEEAKAVRLGTTFRKALWVEDLFIPLTIYASPDDPKGFQATGKLEDWYKPEYTDIRGVRIGTAKVDRCRPVFNEWGIKFTVRYDESRISPEQLRNAASCMSLGDFRPRYGRVRVTSFVQRKAAA